MPQNEEIFLPEYSIAQYESEFFKSQSEIVDWGIQLAGIPNKWKITKGKGIKIAILDTDIVDHEDLLDAIKCQENFSDESKDSNSGHGSHIAGIIGARENGMGVVGIAPECELYIAKVLNKSGSGKFDFINKGMEWALNKDVDIISLSFECREYNSRFHSLVKSAYYNNKFVICSAGNSGTRHPAIRYPAKFTETITVASIDRHLIAQGSSSRGCDIDFAAPGVSIYSTSINNGFGCGNGTSFSAPFVSGISALILSMHRNTIAKTYSPVNNTNDLINHLRKISVDLGLPGKDQTFGYGAPLRWNTISLWDILEKIKCDDLTPNGRLKLKELLNKKVN